MGAKESSAEWLVVAELGPPHGLRGELRARLADVALDELLLLGELRLRSSDGDERPVRIKGGRLHTKGSILSLQGIADRTQAEACRGAELLAKREDLPALDEDEWWVVDLVGLAVRSEEGERLGELTEVMRLPANDVLVVRGEDGELLLPLTDEVVRSVDAEAGWVTVRLLPGLLEASRSGTGDTKHRDEEAGAHGG